MRTAPGLAVAALLLAGPAYAEGPGPFSFARWGMAEADLIAAGGDTLRPIAPSNNGTVTCNLALTGPHTAAGVAFDPVEFCFDEAGALAAVRMTNRESRFRTIDAALASAFGEATLKTNQTVAVRVYMDRANGTSIRAVGDYGRTVLYYTPSANGL